MDIDKRPTNNPLLKFQVNLESISDSERDLALRINALETRIDNIVKRIEIGEQKIPILMWLLSVTTDQEELTTLSKAIERVAPLVQQLDQLKQQMKTLDYAKNHPQWFAATFGDFSEEVDYGLMRIDDIRQGLEENNE